MRPATFMKNFLTFPFRAVTLFDDDRFGLQSLRTERMSYVAEEVRGLCLDIGCGPGNLFIKNHMKGQGTGVDVFPYTGLSQKNIVDPMRLPFRDRSFGTVTLIAAINHIPESKRAGEIREIYRVLRPGGRLIVTMGNPLAEIIVHKLSGALNKEDMDTERGMEEDESYYMTDGEIRKALSAAGFAIHSKKRFWSQWGLNHMLIGLKQNK
jgi:SAM-dependent methyltransferase